MLDPVLGPIATSLNFQDDAMKYSYPHLYTTLRGSEILSGLMDDTQLVQH